MAKRRNHIPATSAVTQQEFLYYDVRVPSVDGGMLWNSLRHLVIKRTPKYVYVAAIPYQATGQVPGQAPNWQGLAAGQIRLNRASLEKWGYAFVSFGDADRYGLEEPLFYTTRFDERANGAATLDCFVELEVEPPYTIAAVKNAYRRLAKQHHPDLGGVASRFLALQMAYRQALDYLGA